MRENLQRGLPRSGQPVKRGTMAHDQDVYTLLADIAGQARDPEALREYLPRAEELAEQDNHRPYRAVAQRARGILSRLTGDPVLAETRLMEALQTFQEMHMGWQIGRTLVELAELAQLQSNRSGARDQYRLALAEFEALQAVPAAHRVREALTALG